MHEIGTDTDDKDASPDIEMLKEGDEDIDYGIDTIDFGADIDFGDDVIEYGTFATKINTSFRIICVDCRTQGNISDEPLSNKFEVYLQDLC